MYGGVSTYLPLKINQAGVIPIIFAMSILLFPQMLALLCRRRESHGWKIWRDPLIIFSTRLDIRKLLFCFSGTLYFFYTSVVLTQNKLPKMCKNKEGLSQASDRAVLLWNFK